MIISSINLFRIGKEIGKVICKIVQENAKVRDYS